MAVQFYEEKRFKRKGNHYCGGYHDHDSMRINHHIRAMMASGHAKTGSVSVALIVYLLALFVGLYHFESNKTRQKPSYLFVRDKLPMITALLANQPVLGDKVKHRLQERRSSRQREL